MPNYRRLYFEGGTYFFTVNALDRSSGILTRNIGALREAYKTMQTRLPVVTLAMAVMPDHIHCVWRLPEKDMDFSTRWKVFKSEFAKRLPSYADASGKRRPGERGVWQRRFWEHAIRDDEDLARHIDYTHFNPVKHGHVAHPDDWPHSTWRKWKAEYNVAYQRDHDPNLITARE